MNIKSLILIATVLLFLGACSSTTNTQSNKTLTDVEFLVSNVPGSEDIYSFKANTNFSNDGELILNFYQTGTLVESTRIFSESIDIYKVRAPQFENEKPDRAEAVFNGVVFWNGTPQAGSRF